MANYAELAGEYARAMTAYASLVDEIRQGRKRRRPATLLAGDAPLRGTIPKLTPEEYAALDRYVDVWTSAMSRYIDRVYADAGERGVKDARRELDAAVDPVYRGSPPRVRAAIRILSRATDRQGSTLLHATLTREAVLVGLVTRFEILVGEVLRRFYRRAPGALAQKDRTLSWREAAEFRSIRALREHLVTQEVDGVVHGSIDDWQRYLASKLKLDLTTLALDWDAFRERFYRRNLLVHTGGRVTRRYLRHYDTDRAADADAALSPGDRLTVSEQYIDLAVADFEGVGLALAFAAWRRLHPKQVVKADGVLRDVIEGLLLESRTHAALTLATGRIREGGADWGFTFYFVITVAHCLAKLGDPSPETLEDLRAVDMRGAPLRFVMARHALLGEWDEFFELAAGAGPTDLDEADWDSFPFFQPAWADPRYVAARQAYWDRMPA